MTGAHFRAHYKRLGYARHEIANELGVTGETIRAICRRKDVPRVYALAMSWLVARPACMTIAAAVARAQKASE